MRALRDTFLHFLADNLTGLTVHPIRRELHDTSKSALQANAINVQYIKDILGISVGQTLVSIDVINDDENTCLDTVQKVWNLLATVGSIPKMDYSNAATGGSPVAVGTCISWNNQNIQFRPIFSDFYYRYSCALVLKHHPTFVAPAAGYGLSPYGTAPYGS